MPPPFRCGHRRSTPTPRWAPPRWPTSVVRRRRCGWRAWPPKSHTIPTTRPRCCGARWRQACYWAAPGCSTSGYSTASGYEAAPRLGPSTSINGSTRATGRSALITANQAGTSSRSSTTKRGKPPTLTEEQIVDAALDIIRAEGLDALSMRRLSRELGRSAMAPYWYVSDKRELLDLVARKLLSEVELPEPDSSPWDERLRAVVTGIDARLHDHPGIAGVLLERMQHRPASHERD